MRFLLFQLWAPLVSWGDIAVGERRLSAVAPSRSAVLGILAASLGIDRQDDEKWGRLSDDYGVATRVDSPGALLVDFHTAQAPPASAVKKLKPKSRYEELKIPREDLTTILSYREYLTDQSVQACIWATQASGAWSLDQMATALREPVFTPYLGRKACPPGLPFHPRIVEAENPVEALRGAAVDDSLSAVLAPATRTYRWEGFPELPTDQVVERRDSVQSRSRWQFADRVERIRVEPMEGA